MSAPFEGGCHCGKVRYTSQNEPIGTVVCHCVACQKFSGSAFGAIVILPKDGFVIDGPLKKYETTNLAGVPKNKYFCEYCGVIVYGTKDEYPDIVALHAGSMDDPSWLKPEKHIFTRRKMPWDVIGDDLPCFEDSGRS